ncbi:rod shape-determining protein MreD [Staphylococcus gallinarum]|uniref:Rod shape-determining protein MreD n=1 Tax=Staphylococcus gallinarum TaxID=1293 RepID=A0A3A0VJ95_STAGA|nr:rod shape-determining protein MreD [Staphylococcus gallinarum]RIP34140.1 rod shape-determining protein MreD [Staphylococcus gallinarum]
MRSLYYFLIGIVLFYIDTVIGLIIPMQIGQKDIIFVPHLTLMYLLILCVYRSFNVAMILGAVLGLITDIYFGSFYGLYLFGYILLVLLMDFFFRSFYRDKLMQFLATWVSVLVLEIYVAIIYAILGLIHFNLVDFILFRILPTLVLNFLLLLIVFPLITKFLRKVQIKIDSK